MVVIYRLDEFQRMVLVGEPLVQMRFDGSSRRRPDPDMVNGLSQLALEILLSHRLNDETGQVLAPIVLDVCDPAILVEELRVRLVGFASNNRANERYPYIVFLPARTV